MSCKYCTPSILENGSVRSEELDFGDGTANVSYREREDGPEFELFIGRDWDGSSVEIYPNSQFRYCPFCGEEYSVEPFKRVLNHEQIRTLLETMRILADRHENFERELAIYRELGGQEKPWFDNLKKGKKLNGSN